MNAFIGWPALAVLLVISLSANSQGTFIPAKNIPGATSPGAAAGLDDARNGFVKVLEKKNVTKWRQTIDGIPVYGSVLTTHNDEKGTIDRVQGFVSQTASLVDTTPEVDERTAIETIKNHWNHSNAQSRLKFNVEQPQLQILKGDDGWDKLVWKVSYNVDWKNFVEKEEGLGPMPAYIVGLVNAHEGNIEKSWNNIQFAKIPAVVGNEKIGKEIVDIDVEEDSFYCKHRDSSRRIEVFDIWNRRQATRQTTSQFQCDKADEDDWDLLSWTGAYSPRNEAYLYASHFVDMWYEIMGDAVHPYRTSSSFLRLYVHYDYQFENAFFNGDAFYFGDGKNIFYPMTSLDVVCHEIGHSVTQWHGGNLEYQRQSGAMNEAYSDILGETCDIHFKKRTDGLIGTDIMRPGNWLGTSMRSMCDPPSIGHSIDHMDQYNDRLDVHSTSGIYNKAWCTLRNMNGWDYVKAFEVFTDANLFYWNPTSTMHCGACGVESAAVDRGYKKGDVTAAFNVVGVSCTKCNN